jgi:hypothetical protein
MINKRLTLFDKELNSSYIYVHNVDLKRLMKLVNFEIE